jgi:glyoxylase-like metal-dependent hydrolase (beta-lactamase superfamily II)
MRTLSLAVAPIVVACWSAGLVVAQQPARPDPMVRAGATEKVSDHVYVIPDNSVPLVPNVGIIVGDRGTMVIDTGLGARNGEIVLREAQKVARGGELILATTHVHPEHDLGAMAFPASTVMIRSRDQEQDIVENGLATAERFSGMSPVNAALLQGAAFRRASLTFETDHTVDLGSVRVRLLAMGTNHTRGDTAFFVEPDGVLFSGDVVMSGLPSLTSPASSVQHWMESLARFEALQPARIVPSHGPMGDVAMIAAYRAFFTTVRTGAAALRSQGRTLDETVRTLQDELQDRYDRQRMTSAIRAAYNEAQ